jgi:hypothetical protein
MTGTLISALLTVQHLYPSVANADDTISEQIRIHKEKTEIRYTVDGDKEDKGGDALKEGTVFLAKGRPKVTYQDLNPLKTKVTVTVKAVANPTASQVSKLLEAISAIPGILKPSLATTATDSMKTVFMRRAEPGPESANNCSTEIGTALDAVSSLDSSLYSETTSPKRIKTEYDGWSDTIEAAFRGGEDGPSAINASVEKMKSYEDQLGAKIDDAAEVIDIVDKGAAETPNNQCEQYQVAIYEFIRITNPHQRLADLRRLQAAVKDLRENLSQQFGLSTQWIGQDYVVAKDIPLSTEEDASVDVKVSDLEVGTPGAAFTVKEGQPAATNFLIRLDTGWSVEAGIGLTTGFVRRPKYGTSKNPQGETIVAKVKDEEVSIDPTVMLNFVPTGGSRLLRPMIQIGATASKDGPAVFVGPGWRLFGPKKAGVAFGVGFMLAWIKDLDKLVPNQVISGTKDIEEDLRIGPKPKPGYYFSIQYKF